MSTDSQELLASFDPLPEGEKRAVASEILRRAFIVGRDAKLDEAEIKAALYCDFDTEDRDLAELGLEDHATSLAAEDVQ